MRAVRVVQHAAPLEALELQDIPVPDPAPARCGSRWRRRRSTSATSPAAAGRVASVMGQVPFTLGMDVCGVVDAAGEGAEEWIGRRVVAMHEPVVRRHRRLRARRRSPACSTRPPELDDVEAAAFTLPFHTGLPGAAHAGRSCRRARRCSSSAAPAAVGTAVDPARRRGRRATSSPSPAAPRRASSAQDLGAEPHRLHDRGRVRPGRWRSPTGTGADVVRRHGRAATAPRRSGRAWPARAATCRSGSTTTPSRGSPGVRCARCRWATSRSSA